MAIKIITDTTCDLSMDLQESLDIKILPVRIFFGDKEYIEGVNLTKKQFFEMLAKCDKLPNTAAVNPLELCDYFKPCLDNGDEIVCMLMSSELSSTHDNAVIAKDLLKSEGGDRLHIVDTKNITFALGALVLEAVRLRNTGRFTAETLCAEMNSLRKTVRLYGIMDTLKYLKMNGRLSGAAAYLGTLMNIKPIVTISEGKIISIAKAKGYKKACEFVIEQMRKYPADTSRSILFAAADSPEMTKTVISDITKEFPQITNYSSSEIGAVVGAHIGPKSGGIAYFEKKLAE